MKNFFSDFFENRLKISVGLILLPFLVYRKTLFFDFSPMDEQWLIENNALFLSNWGSMNKIFSEPSAFVFYRPLFMTSLVLDYHIGKLSPFFYHFSNLLFHLLNVLLVFKLLTQFDVMRRTAFGLALIFAVHPLMIHTVAWVPGRNDSLLCVFTLSSFIFLNRYISAGRISDLLLNFSFFICALFTKENAIVLPVLFFLLYLLKKRQPGRLVMCAVIWLAIALSWFFLRRSVVDYNPVLEGSTPVALKNALLAVLMFVGKTIFPFQQSVFPTLKNTSLVPGLVSLALFIALWFYARPLNKAVALFGSVMFFTLLIIPVFYGVLKSPGEQYEHRVYTSMVGLLLFLSQLEFRLSTKVVTTVCLICICIYCVKTFTRLEVYRDKLSFLDAGIGESPEYYYFHVTKGDLLYKSQNYEAALISFNRAIELNPSRPQSYNNRANVYVALGKNREAIADYTKALDTSSTNAVVLMQRCIAYYNAGDIENAMKDLEALKKCCQDQIHPDMEKTLTEKWEIEKWNRKILADPENAALYTERARFFMEKRMGKEALADLQRAVELEPANKLYRDYLSQLSGSLPR